MRRALVGAGLLLGLLGADWPGEPVDVPWQRSVRGVRFQDVEVGEGEVLTDRALATVHYVGRLASGSEFDASRPRGRPLTFRVGQGQVIPGWEEGVLGMRVGGVRRLEIPPELGYGERATGGIPPNSTLYFEVELLAVDDPRVAPESPTAVPQARWEERGGVPWATVVAGTGARVKAKPGRRVCLDWTVFSPQGERRSHTWDRAGCTWVPLGEGELPEAVETGLHRAREGEDRLVRTADALWQVHVETVGK